MKASYSIFPEWCWCSLILLALGVGGIQAQPVLDLDHHPAFDFGDDPAADPRFAPQTAGLTNGALAFDRVAAVSALAATAGNRFPPSHEVFVAYWGNPRYAVVQDPAVALAVLNGTNALSMAAGFRPLLGAANAGGGGLPPLNVVPGRTAGWMGEPLLLQLRGGQYEASGTKYVSPLVLDLDADAALSASRGLWQPHPARLTGPYVVFDLDGDGFKDITEWIGAGDGLLTTSSSPQSGRDLLGTAGGWADGFAHLAAVYDLDHNGRVEGSELQNLYVWQDRNTNGIADLGEVRATTDLGITWIATSHSNFVAGYGYLDVLGGGAKTNLVWDWWPNYCPVLQRRWAQQAEAAMRGADAIDVVRNLIVGRAVGDPAPAPASSFAAPRRLAPAQLAAAGIDLGTFHVALLAEAGNVVIGYDTIRSPNGQGRVRLHQIKLEDIRVSSTPLPIEEVSQLACDANGALALVLGDHGSTLVMVEFATQTVAPPEGLKLQTVGLRASGVAGGPTVHEGGGYFWFSAWQLDTNGVAVDERVWAITPWGFWGGLSLDVLRAELSQPRGYYLTGADSGFFAVPGPSGTNEQLWFVAGTNRVLVDVADSFGGIHAIVRGGAGGAGGAQGAAAYTKRDGAGFSLAAWQAGANVAVLATNDTPFFYPFLTDGGGAAIAATLDPAAGTLTYWQAPTAAAGALGQTDLRPLLTADPGQGKVTAGAFAHHGTNGIEILPVPDTPLPARPAKIWHYTLLPGSQLTDDCPICNRLPIVVPLYGTFQLRLRDENPVFAVYAVDNVAFQADNGAGARYRLAGRGTLVIGKLAGDLQNMDLELQVDSALTNRLCLFTNRAATASRRWPMIQIVLQQSNGLDLQTITLELNAAPLRDLWFSTTHGLTPGVSLPAGTGISPGDLISSAGRVVKRNRELTARFGIMPPVPDVGLDALEVLPGGEIAFSITTSLFTGTAGAVGDGDLVSDRGRVVRSNASLISAFSPGLMLADVGLDAVHIAGADEVFFSTTNDFFSEKLGRQIRRGDLLSSRGVVVKANEELLANFHPADPKADYGLDAIHLWPGGEIWFSVETGFYGQHFEFYAPGDLLSDRGYVVYRNRDLVAAFQPLEEISDFGLDALWLVTDAGSLAATTSAGPRCTGLSFDRRTGTISFQWDSPGQVFQLEKATNVLGPWLPASPILTEPAATDTGALTNAHQGFYRLRQW